MLVQNFRVNFYMYNSLCNVCITTAIYHKSESVKLSNKYTHSINLCNLYLTTICCMYQMFSADKWFNWKLKPTSSIYFSPDASMIFVSVGYGFFLEMTHDEALSFIEKKVSRINSNIETLTKDAVKIKAHIKLVLQVSFYR